MRPFWFGDLRPRQEARLAATHGSNNHRVLRDALPWSLRDGHSGHRSRRPPGRLQPLTLTEANPLRLHAALRTGDHRAPLRAYLDQLPVGAPREIA